MKTYALLGAVALITSSASAIFTGWTTESSVVGNRTIYKIYANFSNTGTAGSEGSAARVLNVFDFGKADATPEGNQIAGGRVGAMGAVHNDNFIGDVDVNGDGYADVVGSLGTWAGDGCTFAQSTTDSFVTLQGVGNTGGWGTALDPSFGTPFGPTAGGISPPNTNAGWYDATPGTQNLVGGTLKVRLLQIARIAADDTTTYTANMTLGYAYLGSTVAQFGYGSFTIGAPAPGAIALVGLAGLVGRRRRA
jgi:hypothetical protein